VFAETVERCSEAGLELTELPVWYDVDDAATLALLEREVLDGERPAFAAADGFNAEATRPFRLERRAAAAREKCAVCSAGADGEAVA
jgi:hypothetical protein